MTLRWETITPAGARVEPDVYCRYAGRERTWATGSEETSASKFNASTSTTLGAERPTSAEYCRTTSATADVVRMTVGAESRRAADTRSSCDPICGTESGTATKPACNAPRNAITYSSPCGASIAARSPTDPQSTSSSATTRARW